MKTVLHGCGSARAIANAGGGGVEIDEAALVVQTMRLNTLSKLTFADYARFNALLADVFPRVAVDEAAGDVLLANARAVAAERLLTINEAQLVKCVQLHELLSRRMGVVIVGPPGSSKSTIWRLLQAALERGGTPIALHTMSPKAMLKTRVCFEAASAS